MGSPRSGTETEVPDRVDMASPAMALRVADELRLPKGALSVIAAPNGLELTLRPRRLRLGTVLGGMLTAVVTVGLVGALLGWIPSEGEMAVGIIYVVPMQVWVLAQLFNRTRIVVDGENLTTSLGPIPWTRRQRWPLRTLRRLWLSNEVEVEGRRVRSTRSMPGAIWVALDGHPRPELLVPDVEGEFGAGAGTVLLGVLGQDPRLARLITPTSASTGPSAPDHGSVQPAIRRDGALVTLAACLMNEGADTAGTSTTDGDRDG